LPKEQTLSNIKKQEVVIVNKRAKLRCHPLAKNGLHMPPTRASPIVAAHILSL
jgi:putative component of membrane protein insertase Oxa1/YidC/SpoIIIJ protein YidD